MKDVVDAVAAHKGEMTTLTDQLASATPSGVETVVSKIRAAIVLFENEIAAIFERHSKPDGSAEDGEKTADMFEAAPAASNVVDMPAQQPKQVQPGE